MHFFRQSKFMKFCRGIIESVNRSNNQHFASTYMKVGIMIMIMMMPVFCISGCGSKAPKVTTLTVDKDGQVFGTIIEDFDEPYYDLNELTDMAAKEISAYNSDFLSEKVFLDSATEDQENKKVTITMHYNGTSDYSHFNQSFLFYGTVQEALDKGYDISDKLVDRNGAELGRNGIDANLENHIIITTDKTNIITPYNISYMTKGTTILSKKEAAFSEVSDETAQLLLSK